jgi:hypothetical protein
MAKKKYSTSSELMAAVRKLDYIQQYNVCEAFYQMVVHGSFSGNESEKCLDFFSNFQEIDTRILDAFQLEIHWVVNDMDNALFEVEMYDPEEFHKIAKALAPVIK